MKKVTLIELTVPHTQAIGIRSLSSIAKERGFQRSLIFMCGDVEQLKPGENRIIVYNKKIINQVLDIARGSDLVGFSFLTNFYDRAVCLTEAVKEKLGIPVIWGGVHATAKPMEALNHADMVCIGEGENSFGELLDKIREGKPYTDTVGIWFREKGNVIQNPNRKLDQDLDKFPFQDYDLEGQYFYNKLEDKITDLTYDDFKQLSILTGQELDETLYHFNVMMQRGCPQVCAFCYNSTWKEKFSDGKYLRSRSVNHLVSELDSIKKKFPFINFIMFADDNYFAKTSGMLREFNEQYGEKIHIPYWAQITPLSVNEKKIESVIGCGFRSISMGVQTASSKISSIYQRPADINNRIIEASQIFNRLYNRYKNVGMRPPQYDFILDSYWESEEDSYENLEMLLKFPRPFALHLATLIPYPGTKIYERAKQENLITDELSEIYRRPIIDFKFFAIKRTFPNLLMVYFEYLPNFLLKILINRKVRKVVSAVCPVFIIDKLIKLKSFFDKLGKLGRVIRARDFDRLKTVSVRMVKHQLRREKAG